MAANYKRLQFRRGTVTDFAAFNPVLASGEPAIALENGSGLLKIGDGHTAWNNIAGQRTDIDDAISSGIAVFASGQSLRASGAITTAINNLIDSAPATLDTLNELAAALNDDANFYVRLNTVSGIAAYASGQITLLPADSAGVRVFPMNIDNLSGVALSTTLSKFPKFIYKPSGQTLNTKDTVVSNDLEVGSTPLGGFRTGSIGQHLTIISGISVYASGSGGGGGDVSTSQFQLVSGIAIFASGKALAGGGSGPSTAQHQIVSGIAVFASGKALAGGGSGPSSSEFNLVSGISVFSSGQTLSSKTSITLLNTASGALNTSVGALQVATGLLNTSSGALNTSVGALQTATGLLNTASGALNTSVGLLNTSSGVLNTNVGLLQVASGSLNTTAGLNTSNFQTLSGITVVSQSGNFGYNSTASGNISGVLNLVMVDQTAYNALVKKTNTLYFIPSG